MNIEINDDKKEIIKNNEDILNNINIDNINFDLIVIDEQLLQSIHRLYGVDTKRQLLKKYHDWLSKQRKQDRININRIQAKIRRHYDKRNNQNE